MKSILAIINPTAGNSSAEEMRTMLEDKLRANFSKYEIKETKQAGDATQFAAAAIEEGVDTILIMGGDGSVNETLQAFVEVENTPALAIVPAGTGNILARIHGAPKDAAEAIEALDFSQEKNINICLANNQVFAIFLSFGVISDAIHSASSEDKDKLGFFAYVKETITGLQNDQVHQIRLESDGGNYEGPVNHILICTSEKIAELDYTQETGFAEEGKVIVLILTNDSIQAKLNAGQKLLQGNVEDSRYVDVLFARNIHIESLDDENLETDVDGDLGPKLPVDVQVLKDKVRLVTYKTAE